MLAEGSVYLTQIFSPQDKWIMMRLVIHLNRTVAFESSLHIFYLTYANNEIVSCRVVGGICKMIFGCLIVRQILGFWSFIKLVAR